MKKIMMNNKKYKNIKKFWKHIMNSEITNRLISSIILFPLSLYIVIEGSYLFFFFFFFISIYEWQK